MQHFKSFDEAKLLQNKRVKYANLQQENQSTAGVMD